jgi:hypothetical protein
MLVDYSLSHPHFVGGGDKDYPEIRATEGKLRGICDIKKHRSVRT